MAIVLFDSVNRNSLFPLTKTRSVAYLRAGIYTMAERWQHLTGMTVYIHTAAYLQDLYGCPDTAEHIWIDAAVLPTPDLMDKMQGLSNGSCWADEKGLIIGKHHFPFAAFEALQSLQHFTHIHDHPLAERIEYPWQLVQWNDRMLRLDFETIIKGRKSATISSTNKLIGTDQIFVEEGARIEHCILNASTGPIYIGKQAEVMEGTAIRGPFAMGANSVIKMNSRIYGATSLGPNCMAGGEIKNSIMTGYSNKAHDGYMGDSVIGEWCNWGAGTSNSNLKNTAGMIKVWNEAANNYLEAGYKCGVMMGDYSRTAINSSINTGTVIGISSNVFGEGLLPNIIPDFSWGCKGVKYKMDKALNDIDNWKKLKNAALTDTEKKILHHLNEK